MKPKIISCLILFVIATFGLGLAETVAPDSQAGLEADRLVEQMRGFSMQETAAGPSDGRIDPVEQRREQIVTKLRLLAKEAVPALILLLKDDYEGARNDSCFALGEIGPVAKSALPALQEALNDPSKDVRRFAQQAIEQIQKE